MNDSQYHVVGTMQLQFDVAAGHVRLYSAGDSEFPENLSACDRKVERQMLVSPVYESLRSYPVVAKRTVLRKDGCLLLAWPGAEGSHNSPTAQ